MVTEMGANLFRLPSVAFHIPSGLNHIYSIRKDRHIAGSFAMEAHTEKGEPMAKVRRASGNVRPDRRKGHRGAFEKNREIILKTQTICAYCGQPVDFSLKYPHPMSPSVDHIIPVSKGGHPSSLDNLQLMHRACNREKSDRLVPSNQRKKGDEKDRMVGNTDLPLHADWKNYRSNS